MPTLKTKPLQFKKVEAPRRVSATEWHEFPLEELCKRLPKDVQLHVFYTEPVGWVAILVDKVLGQIKGMSNEANPNLAKALEEALVYAHAQSLKDKERAEEKGN